MPSAIVGHTIGTTMLVAVFLGLLVFFTTVFPRPYLDAAIRTELEDVAGNVAETFGDLVISANATRVGDLLLVKRLAIPTVIRNEFYMLTLESTADGLLLTAYLPTRPELRGSARLPWNATGTSIQVFDGDGSPPAPPSTALAPAPSVRSGEAGPAVWAFKALNGTLAVGLGTTSLGG